MDTLQIVRERMDKTVATMVGDLGMFRTGRANTSVVENVYVEAYGGTQKLKIVEMGTLATPDPHTITVSPWDASVIGEIRKAIQEANIGLNPQVDGDLIRLAVPELTTEQREQFVKLLKAKIESSRVAIRQLRQDQMHEIKKTFDSKELSEEERDRAEVDLQKLVDEMIKKLDEIGDKKETELMTV